MKCSDNRIRGMIPDYASGDLSPDERSIVDQHLNAGCASCQELLHQVRWLSSGLKQFAWDETQTHVSSESLIAYTDNQGSLSRGLRERIETHLLVCGQCQSEIELLRSLDGEMTSVSENKSLEGAKPQVDFGRKVRAFWDELKRPAVAYRVAAALVIVMMSPLIIFMLLPMREQGSSLPFDLQTEHVTVLSEQVRGAAVHVPLYRDIKHPVVRLGIASFWPDTGRYNYRVSVEDDSGRAFVTIGDFREFGERGFTQFIVNTIDLPNGFYRLSIEAQEKQDSTSAFETTFPFELKEK